jgi:hypothetical protein
MSTQACILCAGCERATPPAAPAIQALPDLGSAAEDRLFIPLLFEDLYAEMFPRIRLRDGERAPRWLRYRGKWVRWTGTLASITQGGATVRMLPQTVTFDVSMQMDEGGRARVRQFHVGERVTVIGRLETQDDVIRTFYLVHGDVVPKPLQSVR